MIKLFTVKTYQYQSQPNCRNDSDAYFWNHYSVALLKVGKSKICREQRTGNYVHLCTSDGSTAGLPIITTTTITQSALCQMQLNTWREILSPASSITPCLQMADQRSVEMLSFNFATQTFGYKRLAQALCRSLSAFSNCVSEYSDPVVKADQSAQYVVGIGIATKNATDRTRNIQGVYKCIRQAGFKLTIEKC